MTAADSRAVVFPMHEPDGYPAANDAALAAAEASGGRLYAFARIDPKTSDAAAEARRCLDAGARGLKFHPRAERFARCRRQAARYTQDRRQSRRSDWAIVASPPRPGTQSRRRR